MKPLRKIEVPCKVEWESMKTTNELDTRNCTVCSKFVFDVTTKNDREIEELLKQNDNNICVKSLSYQLSENQSKKNPIKYLWRKGKFIGLILVASLISQDLAAQQRKKQPDSYHIVQESLKTDTITIKGIVKGEKWLGWKKVNNATINLWSEENINLGNIQTEKNGKFEFRLDKKLIGNNFSISISAWDFKTIKVEQLKSKDTEIKVYLKEEETIFVTGRYF